MAAATFSQTFFAPGGGVAASCKAYTYVRGTTTPLAAYTDVGLTTPATNPVIGSGVGVLLFYLDGDEDYSLTIKTSDDATTLMQVDYVAAGGFFSIISYTIENVQFAEFPFTGDGAETEYTLPDVLAPSVHSLWIALDGVYQPVSTYSVTRDSTDTLVTFGTAPANNADITIRLMALQGQRGDDGDSAYEIAVANGFVGTEPEWLETLIGTSSRDEQVFSGDGSDLTFVFTGMVITDKLNISIFVDGIIQRESDYSLSNNGTDTTITFTSAPPLGTNNIVMRGAVLTGGSGTYTDEMARDAIATALTAGAGITITPNDGSDIITVASSITQYTDEMARDALGTALTAGTGVTITPNDGSDIITVAIDTTAEAERIRDVIGTALVAGSNITLTVNDGSDTITIAATGGGGSYTDEEAQDAAAALFTPDDGDIDFTYNDATPSITAQIKALAVGTAELADDAVTFAKLLNATAAGFIGATGAGAFSERTPAQVTAALDAVVGDSGSGGTKGLVPAPGAGDAAAGKFLKANGLWDVPSGSGSGDFVGPASSTANAVVGFANTTGKLGVQLTAAQIRAAAALDTTDSPQFTAVNIGAATDTTITRVSAGVIAVEGVELVDVSRSQTVGGVKTFSSDPIIPDEVYGVGWNGSLEPPTKNAVYDKIETLGAGSSSLPPGTLFGLSMLNNGTDVTNDIDFATGKCRDCTDAADLSATTAMTKRLDATWVAGTAAGGLDQGSIANATYHCHAIKKDSDSSIDFIFSLSHDRSATITVTIASPGVVTWTNHGLVAGSTVKFSTTGALPTGITAGTTYYVIATGLADSSFRIAATNGGAAINTTGSQSGVHTAQSTPLMPAGYTYFRRIGSIVRESAAIVPFVQDGDRFRRKTPIAGSNVTATTTAASLTLSTPYGIRVIAEIVVRAISTGSVYYRGLISDLSGTDTSPTTLCNFATVADAAAPPDLSPLFIPASIQRQVRHRENVTDTGAEQFLIIECGWIDPRGRE